MPQLVSIIIPTLNSAKVLPDCLKSIRAQTYTSLEIIIVDGGSTDDTLEIAKKNKCLTLTNPLKTGESGKAVGVRAAQGNFIALIDSDNILPSSDWLATMLLPFTDPEIIGSEPWAYTYRKNGGFVERYSALTGINDPYALITGIYDRINYLRPSWTGLNIGIIDKPQYQVATVNSYDALPTIGANGTIFRTEFLKNFSGDYFFDVDIIAAALKPLKFAKVKVGIIHTFCESSISKFYKKQLRRVRDLFYYRQFRAPSRQENSFYPQLIFGFYVILVFPVLIDTIKGFLRKPDPAWFFHPLACLITLYTYALIYLQNLFGLKPSQDRQKWSQ